MKIGILGGGQLGRMLLQQSANYPFDIKVLDPNDDAPCRAICQDFVLGDFRVEKDVLDFANDCDVIGIEIEQVNVDALKKLEEQGKTVIPSPKIIEIIQDKGKQKQFYQQNKIATMPFYLANNQNEVKLNTFPFVQKTRIGGYDGKGVQVIDFNQTDLVWDVPSVIEEKSDIKQELAVIVVRNLTGETKAFPVVEMVFDDSLNLVDVVRIPAQIPLNIAKKAEELAVSVVDGLAKIANPAGIYAVELFLDKNNQLYVNETACRVHNSGHLTIESCQYSQFDQWFRVLAGFNLLDAPAIYPSAMINLVSKSDCSDLAPFLKGILAIDQVFLHWYGKKQAKAGRKMGHITVVANDLENLSNKINNIKQILEKSGEW